MSNTRSFCSWPMPLGNFRSKLLDKINTYIQKTMEFCALKNRASEVTSRFWSCAMSSGSLEIWLVPRLSSTMWDQVPMSGKKNGFEWQFHGHSMINLPIGSDVNWFTFKLSLLKYLAREKIPYGIRSHWLCSMLRDWTWMNCAGPPAGKAENWLRDKVM